LFSHHRAKASVRAKAAKAVALEASDHGFQHFARVEPVEINRVAGMVGQQGEEREL